MTKSSAFGKTLFISSMMAGETMSPPDDAWRIRGNDEATDSIERR